MAQSITLATTTENNTCHRNALAQSIAAKKILKQIALFYLFALLL